MKEWNSILTSHNGHDRHVRSSYILIVIRGSKPDGSQILTFRPMDNRFLRPLLIVEFLIALEAIFTLWSEVGGQYHLDLMFWPWKLGIGVASAGLVVAITANLVRNDGRITRRVLLLFSYRRLRSGRGGDLLLPLVRACRAGWGSGGRTG